MELKNTVSTKKISVWVTILSWAAIGGVIALLIIKSRVLPEWPDWLIFMISPIFAAFGYFTDTVNVPLGERRLMVYTVGGRPVVEYLGGRSPTFFYQIKYSENEPTKATIRTLNGVGSNVSKDGIPITMSAVAKFKITSAHNNIMNAGEEDYWNQIQKNFNSSISKRIKLHTRVELELMEDEPWDLPDTDTLLSTLTDSGAKPGKKILDGPKKGHYENLEINMGGIILPEKILTSLENLNAEQINAEALLIKVNSQTEALKQLDKELSGVSNAAIQELAKMQGNRTEIDTGGSPVMVNPKN